MSTPGSPTGECPKFVFRNRDAMNYALFRFWDRTGRRVSYDDCEAMVSELAECVPALAKVADKKWRGK